MKFIIIWHVFRRKEGWDGSDRFITSAESIVECELKDLPKMTAKAGEDIVKEIQKQYDEFNPKTRLGKFFYSRNVVFLKVHDIQSVEEQSKNQAENKV